MEDERVRGVEVTIHKPDAPIDVPFADVSVTIRKGNIPLPFVAASHDLPFDGPTSEEEKPAPPSGPSAPETGADEECDLSLIHISPSLVHLEEADALITHWSGQGPLSIPKGTLARVGKGKDARLILQPLRQERERPRH